MRSNLQTRLQALEAREPTRTRWVWVERGETNDQARARAGIPEGVPVIFFSWLDPDL